jgi:F0F1-type ATP synthase membrane subunit b/b'
MNALTNAAHGAVDDDDKTNDRDGVTRDDGAKIEERARRIGWVPKDEFRGDPEKWAPADEFLERGERTLPILLERNRKIDDKLGKAEKDNKTLREQIEAMNGTLKEARDTFVEFRERTANVEQRAYQRARAELLAERDAAVAAADPAAFKAADAALTELDKTAPKPVAKPAAADKRREDEGDDTDAAGSPRGTRQAHRSARRSATPPRPGSPRTRGSPPTRRPERRPSRCMAQTLPPA